MVDVYLRDLTVEDALVSYKWRNDSELWQYTRNKPTKLITVEIEREWAIKAIADKTRVNYAICDSATDTYIGNIYLVNILNGVGELGVFIGNRAFHHKGYGACALELLKLKAKNELNLSTIRIGVNKDNIAALKTYQKCGAIVIESANQWWVLEIHL
jgi:RimJ/RimL family protein N-acetyltransferase